MEESNDQLLERGEETVEQQQIVEFHELGTPETTPTEVHTPPQDYTRTATDEHINSVIGFLSRPIQMRRFAWRQTDAAGSNLLNIALPEDWLGNSMISEKTAGFVYIKCTFKIRIQVNAQPFNAGRILAAFIPIQRAMVELPSSMSHWGGLTGYHHVDLDLGVSTIAELTVPFTVNVTHYDMLNGFGSMGQLKLYIYSPLTGSAEADGTVWVTASDIDIQQPSGVKPFLLAKEEAGREMKPDPDGYNRRLDGESARAAEQAGSAPLAAEQRSAGRGSGPLAKTARVISAMASVGRFIPIISPAATIVKWASDFIGGAAMMFGWSKPTSHADVTTIIPKFMKNLTNFNGPEDSKVLALDARNSIRQPDHLSRHNLDEMSLVHVLGMSTYMSRFTIDEAQVQGAVVFKWPVHPTSCQKTFRTTTTEVRRYDQNTMLSFVSKTAKLWRGSIIYTFKLVKTRFHSGRIRITYVPGIDETFNVADVDPVRVYAKIYDLLDTSEIEFEVPFVWNNPWAYTEDIGPPDANFICTNIPTGVIIVDIVNSLRRPATAASTFEVIVETRAGSDFELAIPCLPEEQSIQYGFVPAVDSTHVAGNAVMKLNPSGTDTEYHRMEKKPAVVKSQIATLTPLEIVKNTPPPAPAPVQTTPLDREQTLQEVVEERKAEIHPNSRSGMTYEQWLSYPSDAERIMIDRMRQATQEKWPWFTGNIDSIDPNVSHGSGNFLFTLEQKTELWERLKLRYGNIIEQSRDWFDTWYISSYARMEAGDLVRTDSVGILPSEFGIGEKYTSLRQFIKRKVLLGQTLAASTDIRTIFPYQTNWTTMSAAPTDVFDGPLDWVTSIYRWQTGGMNITYMAPLNTPANDQTNYVKMLPGFESENIPTADVAILTPVSNPFSGSAEGVFFLNTERAPTIQVPFYQTYPAIPTAVGRPNISDYNRAGSLSGQVPYNWGTQIEGYYQGEQLLWRNPADDFNLLYVIGPPLTYSSAILSKRKAERKIGK
jgi:hypothetical protein